MPVFVPIADYIEFGRVTGYLAGKYEVIDNAFRNGSRTKNLSSLLEIVADAVEWQFVIDPTEKSLNATGVYLYRICEHLAEAKRIINAGGEGNLINPSTGQNVTILPLLLQFVIGEGGSPMNAGDTALVLNYTGILNNSISVDLDGTEMAINRSDRLSFTTNVLTGSATITFNSPAITGQLYMVHATRLVNV